ncbi:hypothetical protein HHI36_021185 [Cryptolaemus montrouzieri]|uniref:Uncharacterized protein n=1 Tax=Cryptolaemus montrouzieri TaxID=559131 RepID=A0ABD2MX08_9CUCU
MTPLGFAEGLRETAFVLMPIGYGLHPHHSVFCKIHLDFVAQRLGTNGQDEWQERLERTNDAILGPFNEDPERSSKRVFKLKQKLLPVLKKDALYAFHPQSVQSLHERDDLLMDSPLIDVGVLQGS